MVTVSGGSAAFGPETLPGIGEHPDRGGNGLAIEIVVQFQEAHQRLTHSVHVAVIRGPRRPLDPLDHRPGPGELGHGVPGGPCDRHDLGHLRHLIPRDDPRQGGLRDPRGVRQSALRAYRCGEAFALDGWSADAPSALAIGG